MRAFFNSVEIFCPASAAYPLNNSSSSLFSRTVIVLKGNRANQWRYRIGDYRLICDIQDEHLIILALEFGHRKTIYKNKS